MNTELKEIVNDMSSYHSVTAIVLGGSRVKRQNDSFSDYDLYVYAEEPLALSERGVIMRKYCKTAEIGNHYWEDEDNCILHSGVPIDVIYRNIDDFSRIMRYVVDECHSLKGYTTCFWHNLLNSEILFDREGKFADLQNKYNIPYPQKLRENIIFQNMKLLTGVLPSYDMQIQKALKRGDKVSLNHRIAAFLASYFDIIFALNEKTHPGEKRLIELCRKQCEVLPDKFEENLETLFKFMFCDDSNVMKALMEIIAELKKIT